MMRTRAQARRLDEAREEFASEFSPHFTYSGKQASRAAPWIHYTDMVFARLGTPSELKVELALTRLEDSAYNRVESRHYASTEAGWQLMVEEFLAFYTELWDNQRYSMHQWHLRCDATTRHFGEPIEAYLERFEVDIVLSIPTFPEFTYDHRELIQKLWNSVGKPLLYYEDDYPRRDHIRDALNDVHSLLRQKRRDREALEQERLDEMAMHLYGNEQEDPGDENLEEDEEEDPDEFDEELLEDEDPPEAVEIAPEPADEEAQEEIIETGPSDLDSTDTDEN